jgi:hypothetical protein
METGQIDSGFGRLGNQSGDDVDGRTNAAGAWMRTTAAMQEVEHQK